MIACHVHPAWWVYAVLIVVLFGAAVAIRVYLDDRHD